MVDDEIATMVEMRAVVAGEETLAFDGGGVFDADGGDDRIVGGALHGGSAVELADLINGEAEVGCDALGSRGVHFFVFSQPDALHGTKGKAHAFGSVAQGMSALVSGFYDATAECGPVFDLHFILYV